MQTILAIETSVPQASIALWSDGDWLFSEEFTSDRNHNSMVFEPLASALDALRGRELTHIVVGTGPGSYSGIRIGIAAAQGVAVARGCQVAGLGSLAATAPARGAGSASLAVGDARRGLFFIAPVLASGEAQEAELMDGEEWNRRLAADSDRVLFTLDDPARLALGGEASMRVQQTRPEARLLVDVWRGLPEERQEELVKVPLSPSYLRAPFTSKAKPGHPLLRKG